MSVNMSSSTDWYTDKNRVAHFVGADVAAGEVSDYDMDAAYKWVNAQLSRIEIDVTDSTTATNLKANGNITMAQTWYACFYRTTDLSARTCGFCKHYVCLHAKVFSKHRETACT